MVRGLKAFVAGALLALIAGAWSSEAAPISFSDLLARPRPAADHRIAYGQGRDQFGDLWLPAGPGAHPVAVLIHGGCWQASLPGVELMAYMADDLRRRGFVVWNLEYRRLGEAGGGYPGTFADIGRGVDFLRVLARTYRLDFRHVVLVGHSAGGQLALWAAARPRLPASSPLRAGDPLRVAGVVTLAGIDDLEAYRLNGPEACGGPATIDQLVGAGDRHGQALFADTSPAALAPIGVPQVVISGDLDPIVPEPFGRDYAARARAAGDTARSLDIGGAGHFELIDPRAAAWRAIEPAIEQLAR
jgi:acetyl esterase/lipase